DLGVAAFKIPSALIVEPELLRTVAAFGKPVILSTGMSSLSEVQEAVDAIRNAGNTKLVLLQCTTEYPTNIADANVRVMQTLGLALWWTRPCSPPSGLPLAFLHGISRASSERERAWKLPPTPPSNGGCLNDLTISKLQPADGEGVRELLAADAAEYRRYFVAFDDDARIHEALANAQLDQYWGIRTSGRLIGLIMLRGLDQGYAVPTFG